MYKRIETSAPPPLVREVTWSGSSWEVLVL